MQCVFCEKELEVGERVFQYIDGNEVFYVHKECEPKLRTVTCHDGVSPCRGCTDRYLGCHSNCRPYQRYYKVNAVRRISSRVGKSKISPLSVVKETIYE